MSTDSIRQIVDGDSSVVSWQTWDRVKHTEWFVLLASVTFVVLFSYLFARAPVVSDVTRGYHGLTQTMIVWAIFALGYNLLLGQTGLLSFGHAMFFGGASYAAALFSIHVHGDPILMVVAGALFAVALAFASALILLRLHTVYFAIVALAIAQFLFFLAREPLVEITQGINGLSPDVEPLFGAFELSERLTGLLGTIFVDYMYVFVGAFFVGVVVFITRIRKSPYGLVFKAIRENETRSSFVGLDVWRYKFAAFLLSAFVTGIAGSLMVHTSQFAGVNRLHWSISGDIVVMTVLGGLGTLAGPTIGAIVFFYFEGIVNGFPNVGQYWLLLLAISFTAVVWKYPDGLWGVITDCTLALRRPKAVPGKLLRTITPSGADDPPERGDR